MNFCAYTGYLHSSTYPNWSYFGLIFPAFLAINVCFIIFWLIFKWKIAILPIFGMLLCANSVRTYFPVNFSKDIPEGTITLLSYNVMNFGGPPMAKINFSENPIVNYLLNSEADIVCIQEGSVNGHNQLKELLINKYPYISQGGEDGCHYNVCMSKFPIVKVENIPFDSKTNRTYAYYLLVDTDTLLVVNNHFESYQIKEEDVAAYKDIIVKPEDKANVGKYKSLVKKLVRANSLRGNQADRVAEYIESVKCKYKVACGDFNDSPLSYAHHRMTRTLDDAYVKNGFGPGITYHEHVMYFRIDNILVNHNITPYGTKVDNSISESDHYPIISHLFLKEK